MSAAPGWFTKLASFPNGSWLMFWILRWHTLERLFCLTSAGLERLFALLDICRVSTNETRISLRGAAPTRKSLRGAASTPLALPSPLGTSTWTRMDAERDKGKGAKKNVFWGGNLATSVVSYINVCSVWIISKIGIISKRWVAAKLLNFAVVYSRAFVLIDVCRAWVSVFCFDLHLQGLNE